MRVLRADAGCVVATLIPAASVDAYHVYFPDPWPKRRHGDRRLLGPAFVEAAARTLVDGGRLHLATDVASYIAAAERAIVASGWFTAVDPGADFPGLRTTFARKYRAQGRPLHAASFIRRDRGAARPE